MKFEDNFSAPNEEFLNFLEKLRGKSYALER